jgi:hypothetical protein
MALETLNDLDKKELLLFRFGPIWDGNLNSKATRDRLVDSGLVEKTSGFQFLTAEGVNYLVRIGKLNEDTWREGRTNGT